MWHIMLDLLCEIFAYLSGPELCVVVQVNKTWCAVAHEFKLKMLYNNPNSYIYQYNPVYNLLIYDANVRQIFVEYLRDMINQYYTQNKSYLIKELRCGLPEMIIKVDKPFNDHHIYFINRLILNKSVQGISVHNNSCHLFRMVVYAYLYLINKFPYEKYRAINKISCFNKPQLYMIELPNDFDFEL